MKKILEKKGRRRLLIYFLTALRQNRHTMPFLFLLVIFLLTPTLPVFANSFLTLDKAVKMAQEHSFIIQISDVNQQTAKHDLNTIRANRYPTLSLNASGFYVNKLQKIDALPAAMEIGSHENYQADVRLSFPIYTGGKLDGSILAVKAISEGELFEYDAQKLAVSFQSRLAWFNLSMRQRLVNSAEVSLERINIIKENIINLHNNGLADSVDILETELAYENGREQLLQMENELHNASTKLAILIGVCSKEVIELPPEIPRPDNSILQYQDFLIDTDSIFRPELKKISSKINSAEQQIRIKRAAYIPNITGFGGYSIGKPNRNMFDPEWNDYFSAGLMLNWEFNFGGKAGSDIASAKQKLSSVRLNYLAVEEKLHLESEIALENILSAYKLYESSQRKYNITGNKFRLAKEKQKAGGLTVNRLLEIESEYSAAEQIYFVSQLKYYINESYFLYAIGSDKIYGGF
ncbi:MAG: TolC family protein [candidate division Zixibacteria bacterium]|nr:TolC family protein [candidate division Zixibacteria bacterium]